MKRPNESSRTRPVGQLAYGLFIDSDEGRPTPARYDAKHLPITYASEDQAQKAIVRIAMEKQRQFLSGELDFDDAMHVREYYAPVRLHHDGTISAVT